VALEVIPVVYVRKNLTSPKKTRRHMYDVNFSADCCSTIRARYGAYETKHFDEVSREQGSRKLLAMAANADSYLEPLRCPLATIA
jgi:hypothetical protein